MKKTRHILLLLLVSASLFNLAGTSPTSCWGPATTSNNNSGTVGGNNNASTQTSDASGNLNVSGNVNPVSILDCPSANGTKNCSGIHFASAEGTGSQSVRSIVFDHTGNMIITGSFQGTIDFGGGAFSSAGGKDIFVVKFDPSGKYLWGKHYGDANSQYANSVDVDSSNNIMIAGGYEGSVDFGSGSLTSKEGVDIYFVKLDPAGNVLWNKSFGDKNLQAASKVKVDAKDNNILLTGGFSDLVDFGGGSLSNAGGLDIFAVKFDAAGNHLWSKSFGDSKDQVGVDIYADGNSNSVTVLGELGSDLDFAGGALRNSGSYDIFSVRLNP